MSKAKSVIGLFEAQDLPTNPGGFSSTINGFSFTISDSEGGVVDRKIISMVDTETVEEAIRKFYEAIQYLQQHKDKFVDLSNPVL